MTIIDAQVHCYEANNDKRPWLNVPNWPPSANADEMVAAMDALGVDAAIQVSAFTLYGYDVSYSLEVQARYPDRFALVRPIDVTDSGVAETVAQWANTPGAVGVRILLNQPGFTSDPDDPGVNLALRAAYQHGMPVNVRFVDDTSMMEQLVVRHPGTSFVIDHLGIAQPQVPPVPDRPWQALPNVLKLAAHPNVSIKICGACTLSKMPYPFDDIWEPILRVIDAFGLERCMWGTDWTRAYPMVRYRPAVDAFLQSDRLSSSDRAMLMGGSLSRIYNWHPRRAAPPSARENLSFDGVGRV